MEDAAGELEAYKRAMWAHEERKEWYKQAIKELAEAGKYRQAMEATYEIEEYDIKAATLREIIIAAKAKIPPTP
jgi:hypothetical protein